MISLNYGEMPTREIWDATVADEPFQMTIRDPALWRNIAEIINIGIDSHLEIVDCTADNTTGELVLAGRDAVWTFIRRCTEDESEYEDLEHDPLDWASAMMGVLGFEWI